MRRTFLILSACALVAAGKPSGWSTDQRACPVKRAPAGLAGEVVNAMLPGATETEISDTAAEQLAGVAIDCAKQTKVAKARLDSYIELATWQLTSAGLADAIKGRGLDPVMLNTAMNVGQGKANPSFENLSDAQVTRLMVALKAKGVAVETLPEDTWQLVGSYLEATSRAWRMR